MPRLEAEVAAEAEDSEADTPGARETGSIRFIDFVDVFLHSCKINISPLFYFGMISIDAYLTHVM